MQARLLEAEDTGTTIIQRYEIDDVHVTLLVPFGRQDGLSLGLESRGTMITEVHDAAGKRDERSRHRSPRRSSSAAPPAIGGSTSTNSRSADAG